MDLLYGTKNQAKLAAMRRRMERAGFTIIGLNDLNLPIPEASEDGITPLENARQKALCYYKAFRMPVFSCDSGLYFDEVPECDQPGVHVRTVNGRVLSDEEMTAHYAGLAKKYGRLTARYRNAICLVWDEQHIEAAMEDSMASEPFYLVDTPHPLGQKQKGFPLDSLSVDIRTGKYYYDLEDTALDQVAVEDGFAAFFERCLLRRSPIGKTVTVTVDRPLGSRHPKHADICYPVNYGYVAGVMAPDGEEQDAYLLGVDAPVLEYTGVVIAVVRRNDDVEEKWVVAPEGIRFAKEEIRKQVHFMEQYFDFEIEM